MKTHRSILWTGLAASLLLISSTTSYGETGTPDCIRAAGPKPATDTVGQRPYELVDANRTAPRTPLVDFDSLQGWTVECWDGAQAALHPTDEQRVWESTTTKLIYRGTGEKSSVVLRPPQPIPIPNRYDCINLWVYGNNWAWVPDPKTPQVKIDLLVTDSAGVEQAISFTQVRWKEWWLPHRKLDPENEKRLNSGSRFSGIRITNCGNLEDRNLYFENLVFYKEELPPLHFEPRAKRGIDPFPGQTAGVNTGAGRLPFPNREETILPSNTERKFRNRIERLENGTFAFTYEGRDAQLQYILHPGQRHLGWVEIFLNGTPVGEGLVGAGVEFEERPQNPRLVSAECKKDVVTLRWRNGVECQLRIWQKSLVVDFFCAGGKAVKLNYGRIVNVAEPELFPLPYMNYHRHHLCVLASKGTEPCFLSVWMDWYRSNASQPFARDEITPEGVYLNGGVEYKKKTDGTRNGLFERFFFTVSPQFEETLATIPNPPASQGRLAGTRLWQESWGPANYEKEMQRSRKLRAYGIEKLTQCNHEITWRDEGESFTFRSKASPSRGGDEALKAYVAHQKSLGWRSGLYTNYCDFVPVNGMWDEDWVMRTSEGDWVTAWARCYAPKPLRAVEADAILAPQIQEKYQTNAAYTDVHTSVSPWSRTDYDARVPGAGTFASTFYAFGELLLNDQRVYDGHAWSEGNHQWLSAGLVTGNYGLAYSELRLWEYPYLPHFDLLKMHPLMVDMGMPWTAKFFDKCEGWSKPERIEASIDKFIAATIAYGHIGWLVEESYGIRRTCRSYYHLQNLQSRYVMREPEAILYGTDTGLVSSSQALLDGTWRESRLHLQYPEGLRVWVNGNDDKNWSVEIDGETVLLPPYGWVAIQGKDYLGKSVLEDGHRVDRTGCPAYLYLDGRGELAEQDGIQTAGAVAVRPAKDSGNARGLSIIAIDGVEHIQIASPTARYGRNDIRRSIAAVARAERVTCAAYDIEGKTLSPPRLVRGDESWTLTVVPSAIRYELRVD